VNLYETTFIVNPQADDVSIDRQVKSITDLISSNGGKVLREDRMGTRRLAYDIEGLTQGYYTSIVFEAPPETPSVLSRHYRLEEPYIRHLTVIFEGSLEAEDAATEGVAVSHEPKTTETTSEKPASDESDATPKPEPAGADVASESKADSEPVTPVTDTPTDSATIASVTEPVTEEPVKLEEATKAEPVVETATGVEGSDVVKTETPAGDSTSDESSASPEADEEEEL
jgi:small subunit ribosomal protein S6